MNINKRTSSIARGINTAFWFNKLKAFFTVDILIVLVSFGLFCYKSYLTIPTDEYVRRFDLTGQSIDRIVLELYTDITLYSFPMGEYIYFIGIIMGVIGVYQVLNLFGSFTYTSRIRKKLKPLNELALKAEAISEVPLDTTKFEELEEAILKVPADNAGARISTGDEDLASIEAALNSLLYRMQDARLQQARFVDDASHELRTPIAVIQGYANMLDRWGKDDPAVLEESIKAIKNESDNMKELIDQLLFLARGDNGRQKLSMDRIDLSSVIREVWEESMMIDPDHKYVLEDCDNCYIYGDNAMIKQSVRIFVQNAAKYSDKGNNIKLAVRKNGAKICYIVQDEGIGIAGDELSHIFERFYRSDKARNSSTGGSGLGLSIAKWIIDAHKGNVEVLSRQDIGTRITVSFDAVV
ncbi:MAG: HAMP domain-containing histidine kinase [Butyrivibrio sp.]|jgi:signal transduction histidine kinase|uniref:histidine kinase n=1 Tax=Butyrivibrio fibrisolvens TaxID=831 RepID=A0A1H9S934_BUTFI|nr:HAMP domain-containing sensor histidine kinase [Butyrivibrio fibrisolvens]MBQ1459074.1 HAMP domain-containing histidine kinase [Butyrivibrio sp.]MCR4636424.1 HAMP domain-containing histidine kinase [Butyrivibrio sp.]PWT25717.1 sensor histidine kinase [Butyrivibrio fibrisolvens]PWT27250.1 sensor histidine kinase [Butyrivibrio fibrisolvens]SER80689.1 Signal transduction histidine kinase [Butyrivibrio fibrisolvens]